MGELPFGRFSPVAKKKKRKSGRRFKCNLFVKIFRRAFSTPEERLKSNLTVSRQRETATVEKEENGRSTVLYSPVVMIVFRIRMNHYNI